jgi:hypothetical protein
MKILESAFPIFMMFLALASPFIVGWLKEKRAPGFRGEDIDD